jgi:hypothetical protein
MTLEDKDQKLADHHTILKLICEDANESIKILRDDLNLINTRLTLLIGFNATFASLLPRLPNQIYIKIQVQDVIKKMDFYPHAKQLFSLCLSILNWCLLIKPIIALLLGISVTFAILSVLPSSTPIVLFPKKMLEKSKDRSEEEFRNGFIQNRDETIKRLQNLISKKASNWKYALLTLGGTAILTVVDILINDISLFQF